MSLKPLTRILQEQSSIVQELGLYFNVESFQPLAIDFERLDDIASRSQDVTALCRYLKADFNARREKE